MTRTISKTGIILAIILVIGLVGVLSLIQNAGAQEVKPTDWPTIIPAKIKTPAPTANPDQLVLVLQLAMKADENQTITSVEPIKVYIQNSFAPNVFDRKGPWTVRLIISDRENIEYGILNPLFVEAEGEKENSEKGYAGFYLNEVTWTLIIPMYRNDKVLNVKEVEIWDDRENIVYKTVVEDDWWPKR